jgi:hypothetical protein
MLRLGSLVRKFPRDHAWARVSHCDHPTSDEARQQEQEDEIDAAPSGDGKDGSQLPGRVGPNG